MAGSRTLKLSILADVDDLKKKLGTAENEVQGFAGKVEKFGAAAKAAFVAAAAAAGAYAVKLAVDGVQAAIEPTRLMFKLPLLRNKFSRLLSRLASPMTNFALLISDSLSQPAT